MNLNFLCCIGAELKNSTQQTTRMTQIYLYRAYESETVDDMLAPGFFDAAMGIIRKDDLLLLYSPNEASAKYIYARVSNVDRDGVEIESISIDAKNIIVDTDGFSVLDGGNLQEIIAQIDSLLPSDVSSLNKLIAESRLQSEITRRAVIKDSNVVQEMQSGLKTPSVEVDKSLTVNGSAEFDNAPTTNDTTTYENATTDSLVRKEQVDEVVQDIKTSSLTFIGYVSATEPSSAKYAFNTGDLWLNSATMPITFPFPQANIKEWNGSAWVAHSQDYTPANFNFFRNVNNNEGYYWFGGEWVVMSTDMSTTYFQLNPVSGKWEIKSNVNLPGAPTTTTPSTDDNSTKIATTEFVKNALDEKGSGAGRNIGDIFLSARTNTGTAVNGAVLCNGARYNFSDINQGQNNIQALLNNGSIQSFSMAEYNAAVNSRLYVTPTFVSNSTDGHVVSDARGNSDIYTVFNGVGSKPIGNWSTYWIQEMFPTNVFINSYSITADNKNNAEYPSTWELQGSNNGSSWDSLDLQKNLEFYLGEAKTFPVYLSKSYKYYRLVFIDGAESGGNGELGRVHFNVRQSSSIGYFGYDSGASYFKVPNLMDDNATVMLSPSDFETFYHDAFFAGPQSLFLQSTAIPRALSTVILKPYVQLFNGATDDAVATCTQVLQQIANIQQTLNGMDYPIYWDADDSGDHSHSKPGVPTPVNHGWYRIYKSGWVEQGGRVSNPNNGCKLVTLPIAMESNYFTALASGNTSGDNANYNGVTCERKSSTQIAICTTGQQGKGCSWQVSGYVA